MHSDTTILTDIFTPLHLSEPLQYFFTYAHMNICQDGFCINLMNFFPLLKQGFGLHKTVHLMMTNYININNLYFEKDSSKILSNNLFLKAFNDTMPVNTLTNLNTFTLIKCTNPYFNPKLFGICYLGNIIQLNSYTHKSLLTDDFRHQLITEFNLAYEIWDLYKSFQKNYILQVGLIRQLGTKIASASVKCPDFINFLILIKSSNKSNLIQALLNEETTKLFCALIIQKSDLVQKFLCIFDPRAYNYLAYKLSLNSTPEIQNIIISKIIERNWYEKQVLDNQFTKLIGLNNLADIIYNHIRELTQCNTINNL